MIFEVLALLLLTSTVLAVQGGDEIACPTSDQTVKYLEGNS